jgi:hypothetical protein
MPEEELQRMEAAARAEREAAAQRDAERQRAENERVWAEHFNVGDVWAPGGMFSLFEAPGNRADYRTFWSAHTLDARGKVVGWADAVLVHASGLPLPESWGIEAGAEPDNAYTLLALLALMVGRTIHPDADVLSARQARDDAALNVHLLDDATAPRRGPEPGPNGPLGAA